MDLYAQIARLIAEGATFVGGAKLVAVRRRAERKEGWTR